MKGHRTPDPILR